MKIKKFNEHLKTDLADDPDMEQIMNWWESMSEEQQINLVKKCFPYEKTRVGLFLIRHNTYFITRMFHMINDKSK
jgi:hypothetical protein